MGRIRKPSKTALRVIAWTVALLPVLSVVQVATARFVDPPVTLTMIERVWDRWRDDGELGWVHYEPRAWPIEHPAARAAVSSEDARFFLHNGFDWDAVCGAAQANLDGGRLRGGSTVSQQVAKNVFLWQGRSWLRKGLEAWYTFWLELLVPKERIVELYLNVAETGPMTFGFEAGAKHWYERGADGLSKDQVRRIAGILPNPREWTPGGRLASGRAAWIASNPAPFPTDPGFDLVLASWAETAGPFSCMVDVASSATR